MHPRIASFNRPIRSLVFGLYSFAALNFVVIMVKMPSRSGEGANMGFSLIASTIIVVIAPFAAAVFVYTKRRDRRYALVVEDNEVEIYEGFAATGQTWATPINPFGGAIRIGGASVSLTASKNGIEYWAGHSRPIKIRSTAWSEVVDITESSARIQFGRYPCVYIESSGSDSWSFIPSRDPQAPFSIFTGEVEQARDMVKALKAAREKYATSDQES